MSEPLTDDKLHEILAHVRFGLMDGRIYAGMLAEHSDALVARCVAAEQALAESADVARAAIAGVLPYTRAEALTVRLRAALAGSGEQPGECVCGETSTRNCPVHSAGASA
jgi:hypothetical protein